MSQRCGLRKMWLIARPGTRPSTVKNCQGHGVGWWQLETLKVCVEFRKLDGSYLIIYLWVRLGRLGFRFWPGDSQKSILLKCHEGNKNKRRCIRTLGIWWLQNWRIIFWGRDGGRNWNNHIICVRTLGLWWFHNWRHIFWGRDIGRMVGDWHVGNINVLSVCHHNNELFKTNYSK